MTELRERFKAQVEIIRTAFERLSQREQLMVAGGVAAALLIFLILVGLAVSTAIDRAENRVRVKSDQMAQMLALQGEYRAREAQRQARMNDLRRVTTRLVSLVEEAAQKSAVEIGQLRPEDSEPSAEGIIESRVDLRATNLSADRLQDFLSRLEISPGVVIMRRVKVTRPYRKETVDVELTLTTYRLKAG